MVPSNDSSGMADRLESALVKLESLRDRPLLAAIAGLAIVAVVAGGWWLGRPSTAAPVELAIPLVSTTLPAAASGATPEPPPPGQAPGQALTDDTATAADAVEDAPVIVHVAGQVAQPGIVELDPGDRVIDAIDAAGGPTPEADPHQLNLAATVADGMQIRVPAVGEVGQIILPSTGAGTATRPGAGTAADPGAAGALINVNLASATELEALPGIGPSLAAAIIDYRTEHGLFATVADLEQVPGIGPAKLAALADHVAL